MRHPIGIEKVAPALAIELFIYYNQATRYSAAPPPAFEVAMDASSMDYEQAQQSSPQPEENHKTQVEISSSMDMDKMSTGDEDNHNIPRWELKRQHHGNRRPDRQQKSPLPARWYADSPRQLSLESGKIREEQSSQQNDSADIPRRQTSAGQGQTSGEDQIIHLQQQTAEEGMPKAEVTQIEAERSKKSRSFQSSAPLHSPQQNTHIVSPVSRLAHFNEDCTNADFDRL
ncbi:hypothetical protein BDZ45DRAFT_685068 [Acephala macrosclerotiorum]|nr:hypothetical protein BDZ45DRAFT_685068 [Acephala macrosclerotiorum]